MSLPILSFYRYCRRPLEVSPINDDKNIVLLRKDVHHLFGTRRFAFVPKSFGPTTTTTTPPRLAQLVTHVLLPSGSPELIGLYHNRLTQPLCGISVECLFARFAWSIFTDEHIPFFQSDVECTVILWNSAKGETETRTMKGLDVRSIAQIFESTRSQSRSISPNKRPFSTHGGARDDNADNISYSEDDVAEDTVGEDYSSDHDYDRHHQSRGRPLKRRWVDDDVPK